MTSREHGFTLVEVMVALLIFGMIAAAGVAVLSFSARSQKALGTRLDDAAAIGRTMSILAADLGQATDRPTRDEGGTLHPGFVGDASGVAMVRLGWSNVDGNARASAQKLSWRLNAGTLERVGYPMLDGAAPLAAVPMLTGVRNGRLRYRFRGGWSDRWDGSGGVALPDAAELVVERQDGTRWQAMMVVGTGYAAAPGA